MSSNKSLNRKAIIVSAPSGSGKTTLVRFAMSNLAQLEFSVSATTRTPRGNEKDGIDYHFFSVDQFKELIQKDELVEWEEVYQNQFYGTLKSELERIWSQDKVVVFDVDVVGGVNLKQIFRDQALSIFIQAPSFEVLEKRLRERATDSEEAIAKRLEKVRKEMEFAKEFDCIVVNDDLSTAQSEILIICKEFIEQ